MDTACVWSSSEPPSKVRFYAYIANSTHESTHFLLLQKAATDGLLDLMGRFPPTTYFFINAWTWGYEDILTATAARFGDKVCSHLDAASFLLIELPDPRGPV